ncbi:hypothetical protein C8Q72DRAFT_944330 [Fomitopsis betulina]|nr:hypothetical protein C8Q72DRAFT_944330 [Fomitopsis betulina]
MASSYISSPVDNESSRNSSPLGTPAALLGDLTLLPHTPVPDTEPDGLLLGAYHPSDNPRDPASEPSVCAHSGQGDQTNLERDDASSPAPSREASATERVGYQSIPTSGEFDGLLPPAGTPVPSLAPPPSSQPSNPQPSSAAPAPLPSPTQPPKSDDTPSTPVIGKPSATQEHSFKDPSNKHVRHTIRIGYAMELQGRLSHIPLDRFMAEFVPGGDIPPDTVLDTFDQSAFKREGPAMYNNLCKVANSVLKSVAAEVPAVLPRFEAKSTHQMPDPTDRQNGKAKHCPDVIFYPYADKSERPYAIEMKALKKKTEEQRADCVATEARTSWCLASMILEAKGNKADSPFLVPNAEPAAQPQSDPSPQISGPSAPLSSSPPPTTPALPRPTPAAPTKPQPAAAKPSTDKFFKLHTEKGQQTMGQMAEYVSRVLESQFIQFFFTIFICCKHAWLLRWDRAGVVISDPFNFFDQPQLLHRFIYRFARLDNVQRGRDLTVNLASQDEIQLVRSFNGPLTPWQQEQFKAAFPSDGPVYRVDVPQDDVISAADLKAGEKVPRNHANPSGAPDEQTRQFLVGKPYFTGHSVVGRGTRGHIAYDVSGNRLVFCKEYWRLDKPSHHPEGETLMRLHSKGVQFIATPIVAGDVRHGGRVHCTRSQAFRTRPGAKYIQYRIIVLEVGEPLKNYEDSYELVDVMYGALTAHEQAWKCAHTLHRDISPNNILIYRYFDSAGELVQQALLIDWGLCRLVEELAQMASQEARSGTWQFISAVILAFPGRFKYEVWHDLEAFIHVLHWMCFRFHLTDYSYSAAKFAHEVQRLYDHCAFENGESLGGESKLKFLLPGAVPFKLRGGSSIPQPGKPHGLHQLLTALASLYGEHYQLLEPTLVPQEPTPVSPRAAVPTQVKKKLKHLKPGNTRVTARAKQLMLALPTPPDTATPRDTAMLHEPELSASPFTHDEILSLFSIALGQSDESWTFDNKQDDQFEKFRRALRDTTCAGGSTRGSQRGSDDTWQGSSADRSGESSDGGRSVTATGTSHSESAEDAYEG